MLTPGPATRWQLATVVLLAAACVLAFATVRDYGATWDEEHSMRQGELVLEWYASGFQDHRAIDEGNYRYYGGFFNVLVQLAHRAGAPLYETSHLFTVLFGLSGLAVAYWIGSALSTPLGGFLSALFLWMTPVYYGHSFNNPKDLPFAVMSLACFAAILACWEHLPDLPRRIWLPAALIFGLTMAIRVAGILMFAYLALSWLAWLAMRGSGAGGASPGRRMADALLLAQAGAKILAGAWLIMCLFWPWAQAAPVDAPWQALRASRHFADWMKTVKFGGANVFADSLPASYVPVWFGITLPEFYALAALLMLVAVCRWAARRERPAIDRTSAVFTSLLVLTIALPVAIVIASRSILYDGIRHLLFVVPPLAILAGVGAAGFFADVESRLARGAAALAFSASLAITAIDLWHLHPFQSVYFNRSVAGGLKGAYGRYETDYWGQSYKEAAEWLAANYAPRGAQPARVANCSIPFLSGYYLENSPARRARFTTVDLDQSPDVVLATTRWRCHEKVAGRVLHVVERMNTPLCFVIEVDRARFVPPILGR